MTNHWQFPWNADKGRGEEINTFRDSKLLKKIAGTLPDRSDRAFDIIYEHSRNQGIQLRRIGLDLNQLPSLRTETDFRHGVSDWTALL